MTELPEEIARELEDILRDNIPSHAVTLVQLEEGDPKHRSYRVWAKIMKRKVRAGTWRREKAGQSFLYWPVTDEGD